jgi:hypothetical protein
MDNVKSQDKLVRLITALLHDVHTLCGEVFDQRSCRLTQLLVERRVKKEGMSFLTKTLPRLGKAFDRALSGDVLFNPTLHCFSTMENSQLPRFLGELFRQVFTHDGAVLPSPHIQCISHIRTILFLFYKLKLPYDRDTEQEVLSQFLQTEKDIQTYEEAFNKVADHLDQLALLSATNDNRYSRREPYPGLSKEGTDIVRRARRLLNEVFASFDPTDIHPRHGPGVVSTKERLHEKYRWRNIPNRLADRYPIDAYFYASLGHVCDAEQEIFLLGDREDMAQVLLVPKDSRGPRLISCEPLVFQWIQQGLGRAIVAHVESHPQTRYEVHFTDQQPNRLAALYGSSNGRYSTLDLSEASDRVTVGLVRMLFPDKVLPYLLAARSLGTVMPDGSSIKLRKYAPMGSALCFPVLALTIWSLLRSMYDDAEPDSIGLLVYGDDVIVPTAIAENAIKQLEAFGLKINHAKSCVSGFFRESCGLDAFKGVEVTPLRIRNEAPSTSSPSSYPSWVAQANQFWDRGYFEVYDLIVGWLHSCFGSIPSMDLNISAPSLRYVPQHKQPPMRINKSLQKREYYCLTTVPVVERKEMNGWRMLLRYFAEATSDTPFGTPTYAEVNQTSGKGALQFDTGDPFSARLYTKRRTTKVVRRWQCES